MSRESSLWSWLRKATIELAPLLDMNRVENGVMLGMPDVEGFLEGQGQFWLELKSSERPARASTPVRFKVKGREAQIEWLQRRWKLGGCVWLCLQVGSGANRRIYLVPGRHASKVYAGLTEEQIQKLDKLKLPKPKPHAVIKAAVYRGKVEDIPY